MTLDNYKLLKVGMPYRRARGIFGCEGRETYRYEYGNDVNVSYEWKVPGGPSATADFENDGLAKKTWFGH